jgi:hypothetical protein
MSGLAAISSASLFPPAFDLVNQDRESTYDVPIPENDLLMEWKESAGWSTVAGDEASFYFKAIRVQNPEEASESGADPHTVVLSSTSSSSKRICSSNHDLQFIGYEDFLIPKVARVEQVIKKCIKKDFPIDLIRFIGSYLYDWQAPENVPEMRFHLESHYNFFSNNEKLLPQIIQIRSMTLMIRDHENESLRIFAGSRKKNWVVTFRPANKEEPPMTINVQENNFSKHRISYHLKHAFDLEGQSSRYDILATPYTTLGAENTVHIEKSMIFHLLVDRHSSEQADGEDPEGAYEAYLAGMGEDNDAIMGQASNAEPKPPTVEVDKMKVLATIPEE